MFLCVKSKLPLFLPLFVVPLVISDPNVSCNVKSVYADGQTSYQIKAVWKKLYMIESLRQAYECGTEA